MQQPLGSKKSVLNKPTDLQLDVNVLFNADNNYNYLASTIYKMLYLQNITNREKVFRLVKLLMSKFTATHNLNEYSLAESQSLSVNNYVEILYSINGQFIKYASDILSLGNLFNDKKINKNIHTEDYASLDVWRNQFVQVLGSNFRDSNKIPQQRIGQHVRNYDRSNEGLTMNNADRASLDNYNSNKYLNTNLNEKSIKYNQDEWY